MISGGSQVQYTRTDSGRQDDLTYHKPDRVERDESEALLLEVSLPIARDVILNILSDRSW